LWLGNDSSDTCAMNKNGQCTNVQNDQGLNLRKSYKSYIDYAVEFQAGNENHRLHHLTSFNNNHQ